MSLSSFPVAVFSNEPDGTEVTVAWGRIVKHWNIQELRNKRYGFFELYNDKTDYHCEGGLWYDYDSDTNRSVLTDYDGVYELPAPVKRILREFKFEVDDDF